MNMMDEANGVPALTEPAPVESIETAAKVIEEKESVDPINPPITWKGFVVLVAVLTAIVVYTFTQFSAAPFVVLGLIMGGAFYYIKKHASLNE